MGWVAVGSCMFEPRGDLSVKRWWKVWVWAQLILTGAIIVVMALLGID